MIKTKTCNTCLEELSVTEFYSNGYQPNGTKKYKPDCKKCENNNKKSRYNEIIAIKFPVLKCEVCGYDRCKSALHFHHVNPSEKEYNISNFASSYRNIEVMLAELDKCRLLCANCHVEVHEGIIAI